MGPIAAPPSLDDLAPPLLDDLDLLEPESQQKPRHRFRLPSKKNLLVIVIGVLLGAAGLYALNSLGQVDFKVPQGGGNESQTHNGTVFRNLDEKTQLSVITVRTPSVVSADHISLHAKGGFVLYQVNAPSHQWVFVYQGAGPRNAMQGVPLGVEITTPYGANALGSLSQQFDQFRSDQSQTIYPAWDRDGLRPPARVRNEPLDSVRTYRQFLDQHAWQHQLTFAMKSGAADVYIATVRHPTDDASRQRAVEFLNDAVTRPRTIHHSTAMIALMLASDAAPTPRPWLDWLAKVEATSVEELMSESDPLQEEPVKGLLRARAINVRDDAALALAVLSDYTRVDAALRLLTAAPEEHGPELLLLALRRPVAGGESNRLDDLVSALPAHLRGLLNRSAATPLQQLAQAVVKADDTALTELVRRQALIHAVNLLLRDKELASSAEAEPLRQRVIATIESFLRVPANDVRDGDLWPSAFRLVDPARHLKWILTLVEEELVKTESLPRPRSTISWVQVELGYALLSDSRTLSPQARAELDTIARLAFRMGGKSVHPMQAKLQEVLLLIENDPSLGKAIKDKREMYQLKTNLPVAESRIRQAISRGSSGLEELRRLLDLGVEVAQFNRAGDRNVVGGSLLHQAVQARNLPAAQLLVERGADVNFNASRIRSPLAIAVIHGDLALTAFLLDKGARISTEAPGDRVDVYPADMPTLSVAVGTGNAKMVQLLLQRGADVNACAKPGELPQVTPLDRALGQHDMAMISMLLKAGGKVQSNGGLVTAIMRSAMQEGNADMIEAWIKSGVRFPTALPDDDILTYAVSTRQTLTVDRALALGAPISLRTFVLAERSGAADIVGVIRKHAQSRAAKGEGDPIGLFDELRANPTAASKRLADEKFDVNQPIDAFDCRPIHAAIYAGNAAAARQLLDRGAQLNGLGMSPVSLAVDFKQTEIVVMFLDHKSLNVKPLLSSLLTSAVTMKNEELIPVLLARGADPDEAFRGVTPFSVAFYRGDVAVVDALAKAPAGAKGEPVRQKRVFMAAVLAGRVDEIDRLVAQKMDLNADPQLLTRLVERAPLKSISRLLQHGMNVTVEAYLAAEQFKRADIATEMANHTAKAAAKPEDDPLRAVHLIRRGTTALQAAIVDGFNVNAKVDRCNWTPLHVAVAMGDLQAIRVLRRAGARLDVVDIRQRRASDMTLILLSGKVTQYQVVAALSEPPQRR